MVDVRGEDLVLAMLAPRLRKALQFHVRGRMGRQTERGARGLHLRVSIVVPDRLHFLEVQGEQPLLGEAHQGRVIDLEVHGRWGLCFDGRPFGIAELIPTVRIRSGLNEGAFDEWVVQRSGDDGPVGTGGKAVERVGQVRGYADAFDSRFGKEGAQPVKGGAACVVRHAGLEAHGDDEVWGLGEQGLVAQPRRTETAHLDDGIDEEVVHALAQCRSVQGASDHKAANGPHSLDVEAQVLEQAGLDDVASHVNGLPVKPRGHLHADVVHDVPPVRFSGAEHAP